MEELIQDHPGLVALLVWGVLCAALFGLVHVGGRLARKAATMNHPPPELFALLLAMALGGALLVGVAFGSEQRRRWLHPLTFALVIGTTLYVVFDLEFPRHGVIRVVDADQILRELRTSMD
jgi:hypothetical protein